MNKPWYQSKTIWFNLLTIVIWLAARFGYQPNDVVIKNLDDILANPFFIAALNVALRWLTTKGIIFRSVTAYPPTIDSLPQ